MLAMLGDKGAVAGAEDPPGDAQRLRQKRQSFIHSFPPLLGGESAVAGAEAPPADARRPRRKRQRNRSHRSTTRQGSLARGPTTGQYSIFLSFLPFCTTITISDPKNFFLTFKMS